MPSASSIIHELIPISLEDGDEMQTLIDNVDKMFAECRVECDSKAIYYSSDECYSAAKCASILERSFTNIQAIDTPWSLVGQCDVGTSSL